MLPLIFVFRLSNPRSRSLFEIAQDQFLTSSKLPKVVIGVKTGFITVKTNQIESEPISRKMSDTLIGILSEDAEEGFSV